MKGWNTTNNRAERALRFAVLSRKLMQGTYNEKGDRWVERMLSLAGDVPAAPGMPTFPVFINAVTATTSIGQRPDVPWI